MIKIPPAELDFPGLWDILGWENALLQHYRSRYLESNAPERSRMRRLQVVSIRRFQEKTNAEYGYVVAKIYDSDQGRNRYLLIECYVGGNPLRPRDKPIRHSIPTTPSQSPPVSGKYDAIYYARSIPAWPTRDICIDKVRCEDSQMNILDLAIAAKFVHEYSYQYQALRHQCHWYSALIISILRRSFLQAKVSNSAPSHTLLADDIQEMEFSPSTLGGTYKSLPIYSEEKNLKTITEIHNLFETYKVEVYSSVNLLNTGYNIFADDPFITLDYRSRTVC